MHEFKEVVFVFLRGKRGGGGGEGGEVKPFRGLGAWSTEIWTSEIAKKCVLAN